MKKFGLSKYEHLKKKKDISRLFTSGKYFFSGTLKIAAIPNNKNYTRISASVAKKNFKSAVKRNRIKRLIKEAYRLNKQLLNSEEKYDIMFIFISRKLPLFSQVNEDMKNCLEKISNFNKF